MAGALHLAVLTAFAVAQPLFDLLGSKPEFFAVRASQPADPWLLAAMLCLIVPLPLIVVEIVAGAIHERLQRIAHGVLCALLITIVLLPPLERMFSVGPWLELVLALVGGLAGAVMLDRWRPARQLLTYLVPVLVIFPAIFLLRPGMSKILRPQEVDAMPATNATTPIVLLVFDELPVTSLLAGPQAIDSVLYPSFAQLADEATWYRNTATTSDFTVLAVPALLTGMAPDPLGLPLAPDHPRNLFTLLGESYAMNVAESVTQLCPAHLCDDGKRGSGLWSRLRSLLADARVLYLHILLPAPWTNHLPPVTQNWMLFEGHDDWLADWSRRSRGDRLAKFDDFLNRIEPSAGPVLHLFHLLLPHPPFVYLPTGQVYSFDGNVVGLDVDTMPSDEWAATQIQQRHLLQVGYADRILGQVRGRLKKVGLWDRAVVVVTADHGASFAAGGNRRGLTDDNLAEILSVPLLIKAPGQRQGRLDLRPVSSLDVLPTIAALAGAELPWALDGISLMAQEAQGRELLPVLRHGQNTPQPEPIQVSIADLGRGAQAALAKLDERFGQAGEAGRELFRIGSRRQLIGRSIADFPIAAPTAFKHQLKLPDSALDVEPGGWLVPAHLHGELVGGEIPASMELVVVVNDRIAATTSNWSFKPTLWSAIVDPLVFEAGVNRVELMALSSSQPEAALPTLRPIPTVNAAITSPISGLFEGGLHGLEEWPTGAVRWTDGDAEVTIPTHRSRPPRKLSITIEANSPDGGRIRITANGTRLLDNRLEALAEPWSRVLDLSTVAIGDQLRLRIESSSFVPKELNAETNDSRSLGVAISGLELLEGSQDR